MTRELVDASYMDKGTLSGNGSQVSEKVQIVANAKASAMLHHTSPIK